jgi:predicted HTH domain antitoxin
MTVTIDIPEILLELLKEQFGANLAQAAREALAIAWYQGEKLSIAQVAQMLNISIYEAEGLMKQHRAAAPYSPADYQHDRETLDRLLKP